MDIEHLHFDLVPSAFLHCTTEECPHQTGCLRWKVYRHIPENVESIRILNPKMVASINKNSCPYFFKIQPARYAKGFKHVFDTLPHKAVRKLKQDLIAYFGRSKFYRCFREERLIHPEEQRMMQQIFENEGFPDALDFQEYIDSFEFFPDSALVSSG